MIMKFDFYISTFQNNESTIFSNCEESKLPIKISSFSSIKPQENHSFGQKNINGYLVVVYEIRNAGKTNVRGNIRWFDEFRYAISNEVVEGLLDDDSYENICDYLKNIKEEEFNNLTKHDFEVKYSKIIEEKSSNKINVEDSSNIDKNERDKTDSLNINRKNGIFKKLVYIFIFLFLFVVVSVSILGASLFTNITNNGKKFLNKGKIFIHNIFSTTESKKCLFATVKTKPKYYDEFISILKNRELDYEKMFKESYNDSIYGFSKLDEETIKYFTAYYFLFYMEKAYKDKKINDIPKVNFSIINKNNSSSIDKELEASSDLIKKIKFDFSKFEEICKAYECEIKNGCEFDEKFGSEKLFKIYLFLPSVNEMKSIEEINPKYFSIKGKSKCERWEEWPEVLGYENEKEMNLKREKWVKHFIEEILKEVKQRK